MEKSLKIHTISKIDVLQGTSDADLTGLAELVLSHASQKLDSEPSHTHYEDSFCPDAPVIDKIIADIKAAFRGAY